MLRTTVFALLTATVIAPALAQTPPCLAENEAGTGPAGTTTSYGFAGENSFAWQITPTSAHVVQAARVFTVNSALSGDRFMAIEIWDDAAGLPGSRVAGGSWKIVNARPPAWQGANLDQVAVLLPSTPYWIVWIEPGFSRPMTEPSGTTALPYATRSGSTWSAAGTSMPKFQLFCNQLDDVNSVPFGAGCALSTGGLPTMYTNEQPMVGNSGFFFESSGHPPGGLVFVVLGIDSTWTSAPIPNFPSGCLQNTDLVANVLLFAGTMNTRGPDYSGHVWLDFPIPSGPGLTGTLFAAQAVTFDAGASAPLPFSTSNAHRITLF